MASQQGLDIKAARDQAIANLLALETAGPMRFGVDYSINGRSYSWVQAKKYYTEQIERLTTMMQVVDPFILRSRAR